MVSLVTALDEFKISLVAYNAETQSAQIGIKNIDSKDHYDLYMAVDNLEPVKLVQLLKQGNTIKVPKSIPPGKHTITVSTLHGALTAKEIDFPKSQAQIKEELETKRKVEELQSEKLEKKPELRVYEQKRKPIGTILIISAIIVLFLLLLYFIFRKK